MIKSICVVAEQYPYKDDASHVFVEQLCLAFAKQSVRVCVIAPQSIVKPIICRHPILHPIHRHITNTDGGAIDVYQPYCLSFGIRFMQLNFILRKWAIKRVFRKLKPRFDVYYGHFWRSGYLLYDEAKKNNKPLFVATGEDIISIRNKTKHTQELCDYVSGVICVSTKNKDESLEHNLTIPEKCVVIPNAIDNTLFYPRDKQQMRQKYGFDSSAFIVAFVGWFGNRKGARRVSDAIKQINNSNIHSIFIGRNYYFSDNLQQPNCDGIAFCGRLAHEQLPEYLSCADIFVLPTLREGCSNAIIEAMACGLPVVSSDRSFNHDILNSENSILVDPENIDEIADAIQKLYNDPKLREELSQGALRATKNLNINNRAKRIIDFINEKS
jgi:glycosyltransferase involved in cell wall biosynthesis